MMAGSWRGSYPRLWRSLSALKQKYKQLAKTENKQLAKTENGQLAKTEY